MNQALNFYKAQKIFGDRGYSNNRPAMHMVFTGNPGTAKTTVARLFAQIMKENGLLSKGDLYEVGRGDIVGKYVGSTAPIVQNLFKKAKGSVLFIDEAYSLVDDRDGLYGDEAINTIVQEMENNREDTVVIFAGYPDKMEGFLDKNPGLRSRIAFHIPFEDYNEDELLQIAELTAKKSNMQFTDDAKIKLKDLFIENKKSTDFGNGRFVRNVFEKAKMEQANRLINMDYSEVTNDVLSTLTASDIVIPEKAKSQQTCKIGF
jgi:AAA+ superfamily predicted ATPase